MPVTRLILRGVIVAVFSLWDTPPAHADCLVHRPAPSEFPVSYAMNQQQPFNGAPGHAIGDNQAMPYPPGFVGAFGLDSASVACL